MFIHASPDDSSGTRSSASASLTEILDRIKGLEENVTSLQIRLVSKCEMRRKLLSAWIPQSVIEKICTRSKVNSKRDIEIQNLALRVFDRIVSQLSAPELYSSKQPPKFIPGDKFLFFFLGKGIYTGSVPKIVLSQYQSTERSIVPFFHNSH